jgi:hypothetical protein
MALTAWLFARSFDFFKLFFEWEDLRQTAVVN